MFTFGADILSVARVSVHGRGLFAGGGSKVRCCLRGVRGVRAAVACRSWEWVCGWWLALGGRGGAVGVVLLALPVALLVRRGAKRRSVKPIDGSQLLQPVSAQPAPQQSVAEQQLPGGTSEPARDQQSDVPVPVPDERPSTAPPQLTPSTNGAVTIT